MSQSAGHSRWILGVLGVLHSISSSGILFCWPSILLMLNRDHHYSSLCSNEEDGLTHDSCVKVDLHSAEIYTISLAIQSVLALPLGLFLDWTGPRGSIIYQSISVVGCILLAVAPHYSVGSIDLVLIGMILVSVCGISVLTLHMHVANLFPSAKVLYCNTVSATYVSTTIIFSIYEVINASTSVSVQAIFLFHAFIMALFVVFSFFLPQSKFHEGDRCAFGRLSQQPGLLGWVKAFPWFGFYAIPKETQVGEVTPIGSPKTDFSQKSTGGEFNTTDSTTARDSHKDESLTSTLDNQDQQLAVAKKGSSKWKELLWLSISKEYIFVTFAELFWYYIASFYIASIQLQLTSLGFRILSGDSSNIIASQAPELSDIDPALAATSIQMQRIFSFCIWTGSIFSISAGAIVDRFNFAPALCFQFVLGMMHLIPQMIASYPIQVLAFIGFSSQQDVMFALSCSYIGFRLGWNFQNALVGLQMAIAGLLSLTIQPIIDALVQTRSIGTLFYPTLYAFFAFALLAFSYPLWIFYEERQRRRIARQLQNLKISQEIELPDIESSSLSARAPVVHVSSFIERELQHEGESTTPSTTGP